jgi:hypothetical protein
VSPPPDIEDLNVKKMADEYPVNNLIQNSYHGLWFNRVEHDHFIWIRSASYNTVFFILSYLVWSLFLKSSWLCLTDYAPIIVVLI